MKNLLVAASLAAGLAAGAVPAFAQSATTSQQGSAVTADNQAADTIQAQNYTQSPSYTHSTPAFGAGPHIGTWSDQQQEQLQNLPGYSPDSP